MSLTTTVNEATVLSILAADGRTDLYAQIRVYDSLGGLTATVNPPHITEGLYQIAYTPSVEGVFSYVGQFYLDAGRTLDAGYDKQGETLTVDNTKNLILRILGLQHQNALVDSTVHDADRNLTSARIRVYDSDVNVAAAAAISPATYNTGLLFQYQISASFFSGVLQKYRIEKVT